MGAVTTEFKKVFNRAHNRLHDSILPLEIQPATESPSPTIMSTQLPKEKIPLPDINVFISDKPFAERLKELRDELATFFEHLKFTILVPLSWVLTMNKFVRALAWRFFTLPLRLFINFYERRVRGAIPWLPSIWDTLFILFPEGIKFPTFTSLTAGPYKGAGSIGKLPTVDVDLGDITSGNQTNAQSGTNGVEADLVGNGSASSQVLNK